MVYKLLNFILVYILSIINFVIILSPLLLFILPIMITKNKYIKSDSSLTIILLMFFTVSCIMIIIIFFDYLFGFSSKHFLKNTKEYNKIKNYDILKEIFDDIKLQFNKSNVKLLISGSEEINAFAIGNMGKQYIILTTGLVNTYLMGAVDREYFLTSIKCILGHEMSHLINKDYMPTLLLKINEDATKFVSKIVFMFFNIFINIIQYIPILGRILASLITNIYNGLDFIISFFYSYIILSIYKFIQLKINREREYRCDLQSAKASGGKYMAQALAALGENGYMTIFSSHPKTANRVKYVQNVEKIYTIIKPQKGNSIINFLSIIFILLLPLLIYKYMNIKGLVENYNDIVSQITMYFLFLKIRITSFLRI